MKFLVLSDNVCTFGFMRTGAGGQWRVDVMARCGNCHQNIFARSVFSCEAIFFDEKASGQQ